MAVARQYQGKPIVFIAVNSGNSPFFVADYVKKNRLVWPVIADFDRSFEKQSDVGTISIDNIAQVMVINGDGQFLRGSFTDLKASAERALRGTSWNVDPAGMPAVLKNTWLAVEFGNFPAAAKSLKKFANSRRKEINQPALRIQAYVQDKLDAQLNTADEAFRAKRKWEAYKTYLGVQQRFKGYDLPDEVKTRVRELQRDKIIKDELASMKRFETAMKKLGAKSVSSRKSGVRLLKKIVELNPTTEAATHAKTVLQNIETSAKSTKTKKKN